jgi:hypothetical protein
VTEDALRRDLAAALLAVHRMAARLLQSAYRPQLEDFEQLAAACVDTMPPLRVRAINAALEPVVKFDQLLTRLEELAAKFRRKKRAADGAH